MLTDLAGETTRPAAGIEHKRVLDVIAVEAGPLQKVPPVLLERAPEQGLMLELALMVRLPLVAEAARHLPEPFHRPVHPWHATNNRVRSAAAVTRERPRHYLFVPCF